MNIANKVSTFRILTVPFFVATLIYYSPQKDYLRWIAFVIFVLAVVSDAVDGYVARKTKQKSKAGLILDPLGDKLLLMSAFICLYFVNTGVVFPSWVVFIVISRDVIILLGVVVMYMVRQKLDILPTILGKLTTTFQMLAVIGVFLRFQYCYVLWWIAVIFTVLSGLDYIRRGFKLLYGPDNTSVAH
ncbi:MAG: CDP-diacylglycerol--glycerol-3-phosphate 3-phosphatidyltransferase [Candidatus Omnitrophica bacterium]|nr:CDP-diacylglycerol--glycerol-3-phosphate 3-phosphatidyltransferase [Candidatus Omnitrophota bacterium]